MRSPLVVVLVLVGCASPPAGPRTPDDGAQQDLAFETFGTGSGDPFAPPDSRRRVVVEPGWWDRDPLSWLDGLVASDVDVMFLQGHAPPGWLGEEHRAALEQRASSSRPCACIVGEGGGPVPSGGGRSTEGREARLLLEGLRAGSQYPPDLDVALRVDWR